MIYTFKIADKMIIFVLQAPLRRQCRQKVIRKNKQMTWNTKTAEIFHLISSKSGIKAKNSVKEIIQKETTKLKIIENINNSSVFQPTHGFSQPFSCNPSPSYY